MCSPADDDVCLWGKFPFSLFLLRVGEIANLYCSNNFGKRARLLVIFSYFIPYTLTFDAQNLISFSLHLLSDFRLDFERKKKLE